MHWSQSSKVYCLLRRLIKDPCCISYKPIGLCRQGGSVALSSLHAFGTKRVNIHHYLIVRLATGTHALCLAQGVKQAAACARLHCLRLCFMQFEWTLKCFLYVFRTLKGQKIRRRLHDVSYADTSTMWRINGQCIFFHIDCANFAGSSIEYLYRFWICIKRNHVWKFCDARFVFVFVFKYKHLFLNTDICFQI